MFCISTFKLKNENWSAGKPLCKVLFVHQYFMYRISVRIIINNLVHTSISILKLAIQKSNFSQFSYCLPVFHVSTCTSLCLQFHTGYSVHKMCVGVASRMNAFMMPSSTAKHVTCFPCVWVCVCLWVSDYVSVIYIHVTIIYNYSTYKFLLIHCKIPPSMCETNQSYSCAHTATAKHI